MIQNNVRDLIEALGIFSKYNLDAGTHCEHDTLYICGIEIDEVTKKDQKRLDDLGFFIYSDEDEGFISFRWGSC